MAIIGNTENDLEIIQQLANIKQFENVISQVIQ